MSTDNKWPHGDISLRRKNQREEELKMNREKTAELTSAVEVINQVGLVNSSKATSALWKIEGPYAKVKIK